jgi:hypothetical protein
MYVFPCSGIIQRSHSGSVGCEANQFHYQASTTDLITLSLVSKLFRSLAAEQLYRSFHIVFPDEDDVSAQKPIDVLAAGLETIVTSDYEYAKHLHEIVLEPVAAGKKGENSYRYYVYEQGYGKFINTLFLLVLRKARCLERFKYGIPSSRSDSLLISL